MGKSPGQWLKLVLLGKKPSKSSAEERVPTVVKQPKDKCRWSFGKSPTRTRGADIPLNSQRFYTAADEFCLPGVLQEQRKQGVPVDTDILNTVDTDILNNVEMPQAIVAKNVSAAVVNTPTSSYTLKERMSEGGPSCKKREDMAAITIQTAFRGYLARRALKALKGLVRLQAVIRGHLVRRQTGTTLRCLQALVRVQARARAQRVHISEEGQAVQQKIQQRGQVDARPRKSMDSWNSSSGSLQELEAKMQSRQEAAAKRERALAYAFSRQLWRPAQKQISLVQHGEHDQSHWDRSWLEWWMDARHWETAYLDDNEDNPQGSIRRDSLQSNSEAEDDEFGKLFAKQQCTLSKPHLQDPSSCSSTSTANPQAQNLPMCEPIMESLMAVSQMSTPASMLKQTKLSPVKGIDTKNCAMDVRDAICATNIQQGSPTVPNGGHVHAELPCTERISKSNSWSMPKFGINKRSFSGPLKGIHESSILGSPSVPNYMAVTQSTKAKARSQSNPKLRPEAEEKTSPVWKRRSLPAENKQNSVPSKPFRSSSANVFSSVRVSRENGG